MDRIDEKHLRLNATLHLYPNSIRTDLVSDSKFRREKELTSNAVVNIDVERARFQRSELFSTIRLAFANQGSVFSVKATDGKEWSLTAQNDDTEQIIVLESEEHRYSVSAFWMLHPAPEKRIQEFEHVSRYCCFSSKTIEYWLPILSMDSVSDDDATDLSEDISLLPESVINNIKVEISNGQSGINSFAPSKAAYYERLIGIYDDSENILEYAKNELRNHINLMCNREEGDHLWWLFALSAHSSLPESTRQQGIDLARLEECCDQLLQHGDPFSCTALVEFGLSILDQQPQIEPALEAMVHKLLDSERESDLELMVALIKLIDGEITRLQIFSDKPAFYRRLAAMTQASLVTRCLLERSINIEPITQWAAQQRTMIYYCQSLIDLRTEPRWIPGYLTAQQLHVELLCRLNNAAHANTQFISSSSFKELLFSDTIESVLGQVKSNFNAFLPGPLEGNTKSSYVPEEIEKIIEDALKCGTPSPEAFLALINSAKYWEVSSRHTAIAHEILTKAEHQLCNTTSKNEILAIFEGLASLACATKQQKLADSILILTRKYRDYLGVDSQPENLLEIGLIAAAAYTDKENWASFLGDFITELAYLPLKKEASSRYLEWIKQLCRLEPLLYVTTGKGIAALESIST